MAGEQGVSRRMWNKFKDESAFAKYTPFFVLLATGKLDRETFRYCTSQYVHFQNAFIEAYEKAEECVEEEEDKVEIRKLKAIIVHEILSLGCELDKSLPDEATCKYTKFLRTTASGELGEKDHYKIGACFKNTKGAAFTLGAMVPCKKLLNFISNEIWAVMDPDDDRHVYKNWINMCSSQNFKNERMLDKLCVGWKSEELIVLEDLYHQAIKLEVDFFSAQPISQQIIVPLSRVHDPAGHHLTIFSDFDLRCNAVDTSVILARIGTVKDEVGRKWDDLSNQDTEYERCIESIMPRERVGFDYEVLCLALKQFSDFKKILNSTVVQSGILKGKTQEDIKKAGRRYNLLDACKRFFQKVVQTKNLTTDVHILSYCWCGDLIRSAFSSADLNGVKVHSNELAYEEYISTGDIVWKVESPMEKLQVFNGIVKESSEDSKHLTVYIGGSVGDLLCLLHADIGIVLGPSRSLVKMGEQFGISFEPLFSRVVKKQKELVEGGFYPWKKLFGNLYTVSSWDEIHAFIFGA